MARLVALVEGGATIWRAAERVGWTAMQAHRHASAAGIKLIDHKAATKRHNEEERARLAEALRAEVNLGRTVTDAAKRVGITYDVAKNLAMRFGIKASRATLRAAYSAAAQTNMARVQSGKHGAGRSEAFRANVERINQQKSVIIRARNTRLPIPTEAEAQAAIAAYLARGGQVQRIEVQPWPEVAGVPVLPKAGARRR